MSRVIIKHLPKSISEDKLRELFASKGVITDIQLKYTPDGKFRQFAFIGYENEEHAKDAIKFFNGTCIQTNRIKVEQCSALGAEDKPVAWSKYTKENRKTIQEGAKKAKEEATKAKEKEKELREKNKKNKVSKIDEIFGEYKNDPDFQEYLKLHDKNRRAWENDFDIPSIPRSDEDDEEEEGIEESENDEVDEDETNEGTRSDDDKDNDDKSENEEKLAEKPISDLEYMKSLMSGSNDKTIQQKSQDKSVKKEKKSLDLFTIKIHNVPYNTKRQEILKFFKPLKPYSVRLPTNVHGFCYVGFKSEKHMEKAMLKNKSFIKGKQVFFSDFTEKNKITKTKKLDGKSVTDADGQVENAKNAKWKQQEDSLRNEESISESGKIFYRNLAYTVTEDDLQKLFEEYGPIAEINLPVDKLTRQIKGFGTVTFLMPEHAVKAFNKLDGTDFHGRLLHLIPGKTRDNDIDNIDLDENDGGLTFKQKKEIKLKKAAQQSTNWNTLFMGTNVVAEHLAKQFNMSKERILDTDEGGSSAAVRIALGETQIVLEMKKFLEENGVCLNVFDAPIVKRSKTILLVKNLPTDTTVEELKPIFGKFGPIGRIVLPPSGVTALIEYSDPSEARHAFKKLAYSKFKHVPLYLEWAPENTFTTTLNGEKITLPKEEEKATIKEENHNANVKQDGKKGKEVKKLKAEQESKDKSNEIDNKQNISENINETTTATTTTNEVDEWANEPPEQNTTLFLRNLNFKTIQPTVYEHFKHLGPIHTVEIAKRKDPDNPRILKSLGYGFIQFKLTATTEKALKQMQFTMIDGNQVELKRSDRTLKTPQMTARKHVNASKQTGTKILIRNIPFQAKIKEVRDIFKAFGEIRSLRIPMKMTPGETTHRGFGFVDFLNKSEAKRAFDALSQSTHLYGRRLVLEWASTDDDNVHELRKRTAEQLQNATSTAKQSKKSIFDVASHIPSSNTDEMED